METFDASLMWRHQYMLICYYKHDISLVRQWSLCNGLTAALPVQQLWSSGDSLLIKRTGSLILIISCRSLSLEGYNR